jgi:hypothetical protein
METPTTKWSKVNTKHVVADAKRRRVVLAKKYINAVLVTRTKEQGISRKLFSGNDQHILVVGRVPVGDVLVGEPRQYNYTYYEYDEYIEGRENLLTLPSTDTARFIEWPQKEIPSSFTELSETLKMNNVRNANLRAILGTTSTPVPRYAIVRPL